MSDQEKTCSFRANNLNCFIGACYFRIRMLQGATVWQCLLEVLLLSLFAFIYSIIASAIGDAWRSK